MLNLFTLELIFLVFFAGDISANFNLYWLCWQSTNLVKSIFLHIEALPLTERAFSILLSIVGVSWLVTAELACVLEWSLRNVLQRELYFLTHLHSLCSSWELNPRSHLVAIQSGRLHSNGILGLVRFRNTHLTNHSCIKILGSKSKQPNEFGNGGLSEILGGTSNQTCGERKGITRFTGRGVQSGQESRRLQNTDRWGQLKWIAIRQDWKRSVTYVRRSYSSCVLVSRILKSLARIFEFRRL